MNRYFSPAAVLQMQQSIAEADGNEVFFLGRTDEARIVIEVEPLARGNRDAVAAIMIATSFGDVVIHNHPSGQLTPSQADVEIASILGNQGVGFYIVDNRVERCYQVVSPFARPSTERLSYPEIERWYTPGGILSAGLAGYEHREEQTRMAFAVAEAFNEERVAVIEAGTGTGKSLAYLLPALLWAVRNKERVVVSTNTINLQEQLTKKDLPFLRKQGGIEFRAVLVKGRNNYLCLRKLGAAGEDPTLFKDEGAPELDAIVEWSRSTASGCRSDLSFIPRDETWEEVCCEADQCGRVKCSHYSRCFFYTARREGASADLLVVNHALLMADVAVRQETGYSASAILPPFERLIFDEGHHLEDVATSHLSGQVSRQGLLKVLGRLQHPRKPQRGLLPQLSALLSREVPESMDDTYMEIAGILETALVPKRLALSDTVGRAMDAIGVALIAYLKGEDSAREQKLRLVPEVYGSDFWREAAEEVRALAETLSDYTSVLGRFLKACRMLPDPVLDRMAGPLVDLKGIKGRLEGSIEQLLFFVGRDEGFCRWFELRKGSRGMLLRLCASPLEVAESIKSVIFDKFKTVVITSATLAVGERFDYLQKRTGVSLLEKSRVTELLLASPFDYERQAFVGIPADIPEPTAPGFAAALQDQLLRALTISRGRAFVLFTSYDLLGRTFNRLAPRLQTLGITPLRQGEINRHLLLSRFKKEPGAALFGTDSFWEGVDVQGKALQLVVITRLPFKVPTEPILAARAEHIAATGGDPFMEYTVPQAVIKFKQGFGRLIRSRDDRGAVLILDSRVLTKSYGRFFLRALPEAVMMKGSSEELYGEMERFFA
ncbi:helicase C-terminal domain-containing protein [Geobacter sp. DSM 9736]|uniref:helicase C-terminal domain-containing protein n=1 Tax=Geobacter sp. DSM 9736 TaxID=1277350 RepID=UPI000B50B1C6|nr:helicase C-terminal domain-containing protein [Geobacter sp. DSM 9736]SNB46920.1 ATP-dependent DNA helicase DinG [Geobacter sp. DSM 9736]